MTNSENANVLMHHGILGQKWGVRRYQNKDGSLTNAGKKRYSTADVEKLKNSSNQLDQHVGTLSKTAANHNPNRTKQSEQAKTLSNEELQKVITRKNLEQQYVNLTSEPSVLEKGASYTREILQTTGAVLGIALTVKALTKK